MHSHFALWALTALVLMAVAQPSGAHDPSPPLELLPVPCEPFVDTSVFPPQVHLQEPCPLPPVRVGMR